eukprot:7099943-Karenia_brevis.AAC.1
MMMMMMMMMMMIMIIIIRKRSTNELTFGCDFLSVCGSHWVVLLGGGARCIRKSTQTAPTTY